MTVLRTQADIARQLAERRYEYPLISAFLDLDPSGFAVAPARATEVNSLLDRVRREMRALSSDHADRAALEADVARVERYLQWELDASGGVRGLAIYCSGRADLFEAVPVPTTVRTGAFVEPIPRLEPLLAAPEPATICVALVSRREARFLVYNHESFLQEQGFGDQIHGQHRQGGRSQPNYERSVEADVDEHLRRTSEWLQQLSREEPFERLLLAGPHELLARLIPILHPDIKRLLDPTELTLDLSASTAADVAAALVDVRRCWRRAAQEQALQSLLSKLSGRPGAAIGLAATLAALDQRQVATLVLAPRIDAPGATCPTCDQLYAHSEDFCPADGAKLTPLPSLRSAMIRAAVSQDAQVLVIEDFDGPDRDGPVESRPETEAFSGFGALLRY